jgi:hypothetical protein
VTLIWPWIVGLFVSMIGGHFVTAIFLKRLRNWMELPDKPFEQPSKEVPPSLTGGVERLFFTTLVGANVDGFPTAMMAWLALKLASNWNHRDMDNQPGARGLALSALLAGIISMLFALLGGLITRTLMRGS